MLVQTFRDTLPKAKALGGRVVEQLDDILAQFSGLWNVQHKDDGSHGDITADSIVVSGDLTVGGDIIGGDGTEATFDNIRLQGQDGNNFGHVQFATDPDDFSVMWARTEISSIPTLESTTNVVPNSSLTWSLGVVTRVWTALWGLVAKIGGVSGTATLSYDIVNGGLAVDDDVLPATTAVSDLGCPGSGPKRWRDLYLSSAVFELARTVAMGYWTNVAFNAGNFTADSGAAWTLTSGDQTAYNYTLIGRSLTVNFELNATTVATATPVRLSIALPAGATITTNANAPLSYLDGAGATGTGFIEAVATGTVISLLKDISGTVWPLGTNNVFVRGQIVLNVTGI